MSDENVLRKFLSIAGISDELVRKIDSNLNGSLEEFFANTRKWSEYGLNKSEIIRVLGYRRTFEIAKAEIAHAEDDRFHYEHHGPEEEEKFYEKHREEIEQRINDVTEENKKIEIENLANEYLKKNRNEMALTAVVDTVRLALLGNLIVPGIGLVVGSFIGIFGNIVKIFGVDHKSRMEKEIIRKLENGEAVELNENLSEKLYEYALDTLNAPRNSATQYIKELRLVYRLANHPDKNIEMDEEARKKIIKLEACFKIVEDYRRQKGTW